MTPDLAVLVYAVPALLAAIAVALKALDFDGAVSGAALGYILLVMQNAYWLFLLLLFFAIGVTATWVKTEVKKRRGLYQKTRSKENVIGNGGIAVMMAFLGNTNGLLGFAGSLSTATADTLSSELGVLSKSEPRLITTLKRVRTGTNGGVTLYGTLMGALGAAAIALSFYLLNYFGAGFQHINKIVLITFMSGVIGCLIDSVIGASVEKNGKTFKNWMTNLCATSAGAVVAILLGAVIM